MCEKTRIMTSTVLPFFVMSIYQLCHLTSASSSTESSHSTASIVFSDVKTTMDYPKDVLWTSTGLPENYTTGVETACNYTGTTVLSGGGLKEIVAAIMIILIFGTVFGNLLVIASVLTFHELQTITNMFVASLACADLIMGAFVMPIGIHYVLNGGYWALGRIFCDIWISIDVLTVTASIETLCAIALDRYLAITKPFTYTASVTRSKARFFIALIWITSASIAFVPVQLGWWKDDSAFAQCCYETDACCEFVTNKTYAAVSSCASFYVPLIIMIFSYVFVFKEAIRLASQIDNQSGIIRRASMPGTNRPLWNKEQRKTVFTFGYIMGIFTACWLPFFVANLTQAFCEGCVSPGIFTTLNWFGYSNSFFNPFIYSHNAQFRQAFTRLLTCLPCSEGFERTKRASLSDAFPRYRESSRDSTLYMLTTFFLSGNSGRKKSRRSASSSTMFKRDSSASSRSPARSPTRHPRFRLGSEEYEIGHERNLSSETKFETEAFHSDASTSNEGLKKSELNLEGNGFGHFNTVRANGAGMVEKGNSPFLSASTYSLDDEETCQECMNTNSRRTRGSNVIRQHIRTRRAKSLLVTTRDEEDFSIARLSHIPPTSKANSSCSNIPTILVSGEELPTEEMALIPSNEKVEGEVQERQKNVNTCTEVNIETLC